MVPAGAAIGAAADQHFGRPAFGSQFCAEEDTIAPKVTRQDIDRVGAFERIGDYKSLADIYQDLPPKEKQDQEQRDRNKDGNAPSSPALLNGPGRAIDR